ncbi:Co-chaperone HscB, C-terminal oligomerization domain-containing protein [Xylariaceae sp. FL0804]|nr:Co-chaperone HscB, C-terminal oligomerization domain-containing protein [Xylariaceae sp. FL0804]
MHPGAGPSKARAEAASARINEAFRTLADPLARAQHVLSTSTQDGPSSSDGGVGIDDETAKVDDPALLMLVLEAREEVEAAEDEGDLEAPRRENEERIAASVERLGELFARDDREAARRETVRLRYWMNIRESIDNWEKGKPIVLEH